MDVEQGVSVFLGGVSSSSVDVCRSVPFTETNQELGSLVSSWVCVGFEEPNPSLEN